MQVAPPLSASSWDVWSWQVGAPDLDDLRAVFPLAVAGAIVWSLWLYRVVLSRRYRPVENDFRTTTSVVVPSFHEDVPILMRCLRTWLEQDPTEVIIVLDVADTEAYEQIRELADPRVRPMLFRHAGKRSALGVGIAAARYEVLVLVDSDTSWTPGLLAAVQMPFVDPGVGAVSTQQNVWERQSNVWRRIADWLVNLRYYDYVPAMSRAGAVACVSGRTGAYRRSVVLPVVEHLENEFFLGRRCVAGDDGRLTWLVLASGYRTVHQSSAKALSMFPAGMRAFVKQRVRWSRNSYRCYLTAIYKGWLWRVPFVTKITVLQILLTPVTMGVTLGYLVFSRLQLTPASIGAAVLWLLLSRGVRGYSHLRRHPRDLLLLPMLALVVIGIALPIKLWAFLTMNKQGWLTRHADSVGGEGQTSDDVSKRSGKRVAVAAAPPEAERPGPTGGAPVLPGPRGPQRSAAPSEETVRVGARPAPRTTGGHTVPPVPRFDPLLTVPLAIGPNGARPVQDGPPGGPRPVRAHPGRQPAGPVALDHRPAAGPAPGRPGPSATGLLQQPTTRLAARGAGKPANPLFDGGTGAPPPDREPAPDREERP